MVLYGYYVSVSKYRYVSNFSHYLHIQKIWNFYHNWGEHLYWTELK